MRCIIERNFVQVIGTIWYPPVTATMEYRLTRHDCEMIGDFTRENVERWCATHCGDFQSIDDFYATIGDKEIMWQSEESEMIYNDCMYGNEE